MRKPRKRVADCHSMACRAVLNPACCLLTYVCVYFRNTEGYAPHRSVSAEAYRACMYCSCEAASCTDPRRSVRAKTVDQSTGLLVMNNTASRKKAMDLQDRVRTFSRLEGKRIESRAGAGARQGRIFWDWAGWLAAGYGPEKKPHSRALRTSCLLKRFSVG